MNDFSSPAQYRLDLLRETIDDIQQLGCNALYLGPVFESTSHGYDTVDYYHVDRRLGDNSSLTELVAFLHDRGVRVILDGVFNHVGRNFWAFYDLRTHRENSRYRNWFRGIDFRSDNRYGDGFCYDGWEGHESLVSLELSNPDVKDHLFGAVRWMVEGLGIDGLRLDVAYTLDREFMSELRTFCKSLRSDFFLLGEIIHGEYSHIVNDSMLDSATNYEAYKGLWSSHRDRNCFEIAYSLNREFGSGGLYCGLPLYNFADNHDVTRVASRLDESGHLFTLYTLLYTMPGMPSVYYGSEWGVEGERSAESDAALRPSFRDIPHVRQDLYHCIAKLAAIRRENPWLTAGGYRQLHVASEQLAYLRSGPDRSIVAAVNMSPEEVSIRIQLEQGGRLRSCFDPTMAFDLSSGAVELPVPAFGAQVLSVE